jgi:EpsI family protein
MIGRRAIGALLFLAAQAVLVRWLGGLERLPPAPDLSRMPAQFDGWRELRVYPVASEEAGELGADRLLSCAYLHQATASSVDLFVAWFQSQRTGVHEPHSPKVCLPGSGWIPIAARNVALATAAGPIEINRYVVRKGGETAVVLYWFQTPRRAVAGEWAAKFWLIADVLRDRRTDTALVRIVALAPNGHDAEAAALAMDFARNVYPLLRERLPR